MSQLSKGRLAPDLELGNIEGVSRHLYSALGRGRVVLVFYKASCPTCQLTFPYIQRIYTELSKGELSLAIWAISQDELDESRRFAARLGLGFEVLIDEHPYPVSSSYGVEFVPAVFIVEQNGTIGFSDFGFSKASLNAIAGYVFMKPDDGLPANRPG